MSMSELLTSLLSSFCNSIVEMEMETSHLRKPPENKEEETEILINDFHSNKSIHYLNSYHLNSHYHLIIL